MANVDKRWWLLSVPVLLLFAVTCCCGGGGLIWYMTSGGEKVVYTSTGPGGEVRLDVKERHKGAWTYEMVLIDAKAGTPLAGNPAKVTLESQSPGWNAAWFGGTCIVTRKGPGGGVMMGTFGKGKQSWITVN